MRDGDERIGTLMNGAPMQLGDAVFGDNDIGFAARRGDNARIEAWYDARDAASFCRRGHGHKRPR